MDPIHIPTNALVLVSDGRRPLGVIALDDVLHAVVGEPATRTTG